MEQQTCNSFEPTTNTSSATMCKWCGQDHALKVNHIAQQTAVEYLVEQLEKIGFSTNNIVAFENEVLIAKEMHKQQIIDAVNLPNYKLINERYVHISGEQYYNETYNK